MFRGILGVYKNIFKIFSLDAWLLIFLVPPALFSIQVYFRHATTQFGISCFAVLLILIVYILFDYHARRNNINTAEHYKRKIILVISLISIFLLIGLIVVFDQSRHPKYENIHDEIMVTESAIKYFVQWQNPYTEDYFNTPLELHQKYRSIIVMDSVRVFNPAFFHYAYLPAQFILPSPLYLFLTNTFHWYDHRFFYFICVLIILLILYKMVKDNRRKLLTLILFFFCPSFFFYLLFGFNDLQVLLLLLICLYFLRRKKIILSAIFLALALVSKQSTIIFVPFYLLYLLGDNNKIAKVNHFRKVLFPTLLIFIIVVAVILPFIIWDKNSFIDDVLYFVSGKSSTSYPINGVGFSNLIYQAHLVNSVNDYYPFIIWQLVITIPIMIYLIIKQLKDNSLKRLILNYALTLFVFWFFSRYFFNTHMMYIACFLPVAYFIEPS